MAATRKQHKEVPDGGSYIVMAGPSGTVWSTQAGGLACTHPEAEGVLVPIPVDRAKLGCCSPNVAAINEALAPWGWEVDEERRRENTEDEWSDEAWVPIRAGKATGWLTYENCD